MITVHHRQMLFTPPAAAPHGHVGYVAGRYRDGAHSDVWTDVRRCAHQTFTAFAPACSCGWRGAPVPVTDTALIVCRRVWTRDHLTDDMSASRLVEHGSVLCTALVPRGDDAC